MRSEFETSPWEGNGFLTRSNSLLAAVEAEKACGFW